MTQSPPFDATPMLRLAARWRLDRLRRLDPVAAQAGLLRRLLARAAGTRFGRAHGFASIRDVASYQARVKLRRYEDFWSEWWQPAYPALADVTWPGRIPYLALSSGTSAGRTKFIPVSPEMVRANRAAGFDVLAWHLAAHPSSRVFAGLSFMLGGSTALPEVAPGIRQGDLSGIAAQEVPALLRRWSFPPTGMALIEAWDHKLLALVEATPPEAIRVLTGTPSWLLMLLHSLAERHGAPPLPLLELLVHGGTAWQPYRDRIRRLLPPGCATREVYPASEGFCAIADRGEGEGLRLNLDRGVFWEFVPMAELHAAEPTRHWVATVEPGVDYAVILSSCAGLWSYVLGDTVRFLSRDPPRLLVTGRTAQDLSAFGEHLTSAEIETALWTAAAGAGGKVLEFTMGPEIIGSRGRHHWLIEVDCAGSGLAGRLAEAIDARLGAGNDDYATHRRAGQLAPPRVTLLPEGSFLAWMRHTGRLGGQHKVPRVIADAARFDEAVRDLAGQRVPR
ncbi:GH3 family domain-containing protein [Falsiroseomonas sp. E2-1-a20]|uniref:GH3 family domain-containing protein n=1 Tax=Falsiroseomonas sp. E2-1-a20 TaxID=3239300 RepID=UPI003F3979F5